MLAQGKFNANPSENDLKDILSTSNAARELTTRGDTRGARTDVDQEGLLGYCTQIITDVDEES